MAAPDWDALAPRVERLIELAEAWLESHAPRNTRSIEARAYRWRDGGLDAIEHPDVYPLDALIGVERSVARLRANVAAFTSKRPALDCLLYGERGTGKSSAVRGLLGDFGDAGFRLVDVRREDLFELPDLFAALRGQPERFGLFCDDLSFEEGDASYKRLKAVLDGGLEARPENVLIFATSNRRHLLPEYYSENAAARLDTDGVLHPGETAEEKISLSDRFGLLLPFFAFDQDTYLRIVEFHARAIGLADRISPEQLRARALRFALERSARSGRTARHACIAISQALEEQG